MPDDNKLDLSNSNNIEISRWLSNNANLVTEKTIKLEDCIKLKPSTYISLNHHKVGDYLGYYTAWCMCNCKGKFCVVQDGKGVLECYFENVEDATYFKLVLG